MYSAHLVTVAISPGEAEGPGPELREHRPQLTHQVIIAGAHRLVHNEPPHLKKDIISLGYFHEFSVYIPHPHQFP